MGLHFRQRNGRPPSVMRAEHQWSQSPSSGSTPRIEGRPEPFPATPTPAHDRLYFWLGVLGTAAAGAVYLSR